jgi:Spy/CpxP family protein refolding chaperone
MEPFIKIAGLTKKRRIRFMKKIVFIALSLTILSLAALPLSAEKKGKGDGECGYGMGVHKPFMHFNKIQEKLGLTNDQVDKMYKIHKDYMEKIYQNRNNADKIKELRDKCRGEMASVLTPEQKAKWDNFAKDKKVKKNKGKDKKNKKGGHGHHIGMMQNKLGLSNEQSDKIFKIHKDYMDKFYQNRNDENKIKELHAKQISEIHNVLTPEQKAKCEEMKQNRQKGGKK